MRGKRNTTVQPEIENTSPEPVDNPEDAPPELQNSTNFPPGYGDLIIETADRVVFHFPSFLLGHVSPVFKDMLAIGKPRKRSEKAITIAEDSGTWDEFLSHIDPGRTTPAFNPMTAFYLMMAAEKYDVRIILEWFQREVLHEVRSDKKIFVAPVVQYPLSIYSIAVYHKFDLVAQHALRELLRCNHTKLIESDAIIDIDQFRSILRARERRVEWLNSLISKLYGIIEPCNPCCPCNSSRDSWFCDLTNAIRTEPSWAAFKRFSDHPQESDHKPWVKRSGAAIATIIRKYKTACVENEDKLPELL